MPNITITNSFSANTTISSSQVNTNFTDVSTYLNNRNTAAATWDAVSVSSATYVPGAFNNSTGTQNIANFQDNGTNVLSIADGGATTITATNGGTSIPLTVNNGTSTGNICAMQDNAVARLTLVDHADCILRLSASTTIGPYIQFQESGTTTWAIGNDLNQFTDGFVFRDSTNSQNKFIVSAATTGEAAILDSSVANGAYLLFYSVGVNKWGIGHNLGQSANNFVIRDNANSVNCFLARANGGITVLTSGLVVGAPTGADKGLGTGNFAADIYKNNTAYNNPDYVLEHWATGKIEKFIGNDGASEYFSLMPIEDTEEFARSNFTLPLIKYARDRETSLGGLGLFSGGDAVLASLEEAYLHLFDINKRLKRLEQKCAA